MYIPELAYRQRQWQCDPDLLSLRLSHCNRVANMRKQLFQLIDDRVRVEITAYNLLQATLSTSPVGSPRCRKSKIAPALLIVVLRSDKSHTRKALLTAA